MPWQNTVGMGNEIAQPLEILRIDTTEKETGPIPFQERDVIELILDFNFDQFFYDLEIACHTNLDIE